MLQAKRGCGPDGFGRPHELKIMLKKCMKAVVYSAYGPPEGLHLTEVATPTLADDEVLIKVLAVSVNRPDWEHLTGKPLYARFHGLFKPKRGSRILGSDSAGRVERAGKNHRRFHPGDEVFGEMWLYHRGFAEYVCTRGTAWALKPPSMTFEQAAAIPQAGVIALKGIREHGHVQRRLDAAACADAAWRCHALPGHRWHAAVADGGALRASTTRPGGIRPNRGPLLLSV